MHRNRLALALTKLFGPLDERTLAELAARIEPVQMPHGEVLYREGDPGISMHFVLTGRLQVRVRNPDGDEKIVAYLAPGESVGEMALFTGAGRTATVVAIRDSVLGQLTRATFDDVMVMHPRAVFSIARLIIGRLTATQSRGASRAPLKNIALVPIDQTVNLEEFGRRLQLALLKFGTTLYLDANTVHEMLGVGSRSDGAALGMELGSLLDESEKTHDYMICGADHGPTDWTRKCIGYADKILLVGAADASPAVSALETELLHDPRIKATEKELVLVHRDMTRLPALTSAWLAGRQVNRHHHVAWQGNEGFNRLARRLSNNAVTLVLGGGGARGFAHIGAIRAIREAGIPIDAAGGTSFGALIAALVALGRSDESVFEESKSAFMEGRPLDDYTFPIVSLVKGDRLAAVLKKHYGGVDIEDLWIPFFAVASNLSRNRIAVQTTGELWKALRASVSLPGILPPFIEQGELLIDGGLLNNLPVDIMKEMVMGKTIAIDLSVEEEYRVEREAMPSAYEFLKGKLFPQEREALDVPTLNRVVIKATMLGGSRFTAQVKSAADLYLNPPVGAFDLLAWDRIHDIVELGYQYTKRTLDGWLADHADVAHRDEIFDSRFTRNDP